MRQTLLCAALLLAVSTTAVAEAPGGQAENLDPVVVTATRTEQPLTDALAPVTVVTRADIERLQPLSMYDLLTGLPGVAFANAGGIGQQTSLFLRGTNSTHTLVLIDGVRIGSVSAGLAAFEQIPVDQIERIEIVRGPRSSLYGADALGGVIQIFTRRGQAGEAPTPSFSVTTGSHGYAGATAGLSGGGEHVWYNLSLGGRYTRGINSCRDGAAEAGAGCFADEPDKDAYRNYNGLLTGGYRWDNGTELAFTGMRSKNDVEYDGSPYGGNLAVNEQRVAGARLRFAPLRAWTVTLDAGRSKDLATTWYQGTYHDIYAGTDTYYPRTPVGYADSRRDQASWQNDLTLAADQLLSVGVDYQRERIDSATGYLDTERHDTGAYAQYQGTFGHNEWQASLRRDDNSQYGGHTTGALAWGYTFAHDLRLTASYGTAFHAPTFNDLYYPYGSGNPDLRPETSRNIELGLGARHDRWHWQVQAYQNTIRDLIVLDAAYVPDNIGRARIRGVEGELGGRWGDWRATGYVTWMQPQTRDGSANDGNLLPRRFEHSARLDLDRALGAFSIGTTLYVAGRRYDDAANLHPVGGYAKLDLRAAWHFAAAWQVQARVANVLDRDYETSRYFNQPGRTGYLTLRYSPQ